MASSLQDTLALLKGAKNKYSRSAGKTVQLKEGKTKLRILRPVGAVGAFWRDVGQHWIKPGEKEKAVAVVGSRAITFEQDCAVGNAIEQAIISGVDDDAIKLYKSWRPRKFVLLCALVLDGPDAGPEPQIVQLSSGPFHDALAVAETYGESGIDAFDPKTGIDMVFERRGKMLDTEYTVMAAPASKPFDPAILTRLPDMDAFIEKEYFRQGDDRKALIAISQITGINFTTAALPAPTATATLAAPRAPSGVLTGTAAKLAELSAVETPAPVAPVAPAATVTPPAAPVAPAVEEEDEDEKALRLAQERIAAKKAAKAAEAKAAEAQAAAAPAAPAATTAGEFGGDIDMADLDATLAELDGL